MVELSGTRTMSDTRQRLHELIDQLAPEQFDAVAARLQQGFDVLGLPQRQTAFTGGYGDGTGFAIRSRA